MPHHPNRLRYHATHRVATWLELFFDLVFVVVVSKITHFLAHTHHGHLDAGIFWKLPLTLLPVWWIWLLHTGWSNLYDCDSKRHRVASLVVVAQMLVLSTVIVTDWESAYPLFNLCCFGLRLTLAFLYAFQSGHHEGYESIGKARGRWIFITALISVASALFPAPLRYGVFYLGLGLDMLHPIFLHRAGKIPSYHLHHLVERLGLLIIILMGESILTLSAGLGGVVWTQQSILAAISGAVMIGATWWIYFDNYNRLADHNGRIQDGLALVYPHYFTCLGLAVLANVIHHAIHPGLDRHDYQLMAFAGMTVFYLGKQIPYFYKFPGFRGYIYINTVVTLALSAAALLLPDNTAILLGLTLALLIYITLNTLTTIRRLREMDAEAENVQEHH